MSIGKIGVNYTKKQCIPEQVILDDGTVSTSISQVLNKWKHDFSSLFVNRSTEDLSDVNDDAVNNHSNNATFNNIISVVEVKKAVLKAKRGNAYGIDGIHAEVL